jgi:DNA-binding transcriptional regulator LsrR (DeoR family)
MALRHSDQIVHKAAWLYYSHGMRQDEVAEQLGISRASVASHLKRARETGIVTISTSTQLFGEELLARQVEDAFELQSVWIVPDGDDALDPEVEMPVLAASVFLGLIDKGDRIAVAWGRTVYQIADVMPFADLQGVTVVQLCGNLGAPYSYTPDQCTMEIARRLNARGINLYAPLVLSSERLAAELKLEPVVQEQLAGISSCDLALFSVGGIDDDSHVVECGALTRKELRALRLQGAAGVVAGQLIDGAGEVLDCAYNKRLISADLASIKAIAKRLAVVLQAQKFGPLMAALAGRLATHLIITRSMAERLVSARSARPAAPAG